MRTPASVNQKRFSDFGELLSDRKQFNRLVAVLERMGFYTDEAGMIFPFVELLNLVLFTPRINKYPSEKSIRIF
jgi:hypothetical protein